MKSCSTVCVNHFWGTESTEVLEDARRCFCRRCCLSGIDSTHHYDPQYEHTTIGVWSKWTDVVQMEYFKRVVGRTHERMCLNLYM